MKRTLMLVLGLALASGTVNAADEIEAASLDELLQMVKEGNVINRAPALAPALAVALAPAVTITNISNRTRKKHQQHGSQHQ